MSRRKDRERYLDRKHTNPEYDGFRGLESEPDRAGNTPLRTVTCSTCGRRRNVAVGIANDGGGTYVCLSCREAQSETVDSEVVTN